MTPRKLFTRLSGTALHLMAKRARAAPKPPSKRPPKLVPLGASALWRVHPRAYRSMQFNTSDQGDARFSPIRRADGSVIPVLYGASTLAGAIMETVFHDVPTPPDGYIFDIDTLRDQGLVVSRIRPKRRIKVVDLSTKGLKRLGLHRTDLIDTSVTAYPRTREWAAWLYASTAGKGLVWTSRQDDGARAVVLFADRVQESAFKVEIDRESLCDGPHFTALLDIAEHIGIDAVFGL